MTGSYHWKVQGLKQRLALGTPCPGAGFFSLTSPLRTGKVVVVVVGGTPGCDHPTAPSSLSRGALIGLLWSCAQLPTNHRGRGALGCQLGSGAHSWEQGGEPNLLQGKGVDLTSKEPGVGGQGSGWGWGYGVGGLEAQGRGL